MTRSWHPALTFGGRRARQARGPAPNGHLVFITKYRRGVPDDDIPRYREQVMRTACRDSETDLREFTGQAGHVHLPGNYTPKASVPALANSLTGISARMPRS